MPTELPLNSTLRTYCSARTDHWSPSTSTTAWWRMQKRPPCTRRPIKREKTKWQLKLKREYAKQRLRHKQSLSKNKKLSNLKLRRRLLALRWLPNRGLNWTSNQESLMSATCTWSWMDRTYLRVATTPQTQWRRERPCLSSLMLRSTQGCAEWSLRRLGRVKPRNGCPSISVLT